jgi:general secretion pathway protein D
VQVPVGSPVNLNVQLDGAVDAFSASPIRVKWDPAILRLNDITPGDLLSGDGNQATSVKDIRNDVGEASISIARRPGAGVNGAGTVATLNFVAVGRGAGAVAVTEINLRNTQAQPLAVTLGSVPVNVQ